MGAPGLSWAVPAGPARKCHLWGRRPRAARRRTTPRGVGARRLLCVPGGISVLSSTLRISWIGGAYQWPARRGRPPLTGKALPRLSTSLTDPATAGTTVVVAQWYGAQQRTRLATTGTAGCSKAGTPPVPSSAGLSRAGGWRRPAKRRARIARSARELRTVELRRGLLVCPASFTRDRAAHGRCPRWSAARHCPARPPPPA